MGELEIKEEFTEVEPAVVSQIKIEAPFVSSISSYGESLKKMILTLASTGNFEGAKKELEFYEKAGRNTPGFQKRTEHYFRHCLELLDGIENLKHFPNFDNLRAAQQKQIRERIQTYAADLSSILGRIDKVSNDLKIQDVRSTLWVIRSLTFCSISILLGIAFVEAVAIFPNPVGILNLIHDNIFKAIGM